MSEVRKIKLQLQLLRLPASLSDGKDDTGSFFHRKMKIGDIFLVPNHTGGYCINGTQIMFYVPVFERLLVVKPRRKTIIDSL